MNVIIGGLSYFLGLLMDVFFRGLTFIGYPRLWACIVLFAVATRFLFLPQRINSYKSKLLAPVVRKEILAVDPNFFEKTTDKELTVKRATLKKQINKKYKLSNSSGCLTTLIQYPFLVALFYVVKNPQEFIPSLEALSNVSSHVNTLLGLSLSAVPLKNFSFTGLNWLILCVPLVIVLSNFTKMFSTFKNASTMSQKITSGLLGLLVVGLLGWFSLTLPVAISLYWIVNDLTYMVFDYFIHKFLPRNKVVSKILKYYNEDIQVDNSAVENNSTEEQKTDTLTLSADSIDNIQDAEGVQPDTV